MAKVAAANPTKRYVLMAVQVKSGNFTEVEVAKKKVADENEKQSKEGEKRSKEATYNFSTLLPDGRWEYLSAGFHTFSNDITKIQLDYLRSEQEFHEISNWVITKVLPESYGDAKYFFVEKHTLPKNGRSLPK